MRTRCRTALSVLLLLAMLLSLGLSAFAEEGISAPPEETAVPEETAEEEIVPEPVETVTPEPEETAPEAAEPEATEQPTTPAVEETEEGGSIAVTEHAAPTLDPDKLPEEEPAVYREIFVSAEGDDESGDGSREAPFFTLAKAAESANYSAEDQIYIILLSDLNCRKLARFYNKDVTILSENGTWKLSRDPEFETSYDAVRGLYNPALIECGRIEGTEFTAARLTLANVVLDDGGLHGGSRFAEQAYVNDNWEQNADLVQDGIVAAYDGGAEIILTDGTKLLNYGGMSAVYLGGDAKLRMDEGSAIVDTLPLVLEEGQSLLMLRGGAAELGENPSLMDHAWPFTGEAAEESAEEKEAAETAGEEPAEGSLEDLFGEGLGETMLTEGGIQLAPNGLNLPDVSVSDLASLELTSEPADLAENALALSYDVDYTLSFKLGDTIKTTIQAMASMVSASEGSITVTLDERLTPKTGLDGKLSYSLNSNVFEITEVKNDTVNHVLSFSFTLAKNWSLHLDDAESMNLSFGASLPSLYYTTRSPENVLDASADAALAIQTDSKRFDMKAKASASTRMLEAATIYLVYDPVSGNGAPPAEWVSPQSSYTLKTDPVPYHDAQDGKPVVFIGWTEERDTTIYSMDSIAPATVEKVNLEKEHLILPDRKDVYAVYGYDENEDGIADVLQDFLTLSYDANGGSDAPAPETKLSTTLFGGAKFDISSTEPTRKYYTFKGWSEEPDATEAEYKYDADRKADRDLLIHENTTLYAVWEENPKYTLYYNANGGSGAPGAQTVPSEKGISAMNISSTLPSRSGYSFLGWSARRGGTAAYFPGDAVQISNGNVMLYAVWQRGTGSGSRGSTGSGYTGSGYSTSPKTGDQNNAILYVALGGISLVALCAIGVGLARGKKGKKKQK